MYRTSHSVFSSLASLGMSLKGLQRSRKALPTEALESLRGLRLIIPVIGGLRALKALRKPRIALMMHFLAGGNDVLRHRARKENGKILVF